MAWDWADGFDCYANATDYFPYYWDSGNAFFVPNNGGRWPGTRCMGSSGTGIYLNKASNVNDPVHHFVFSFNTIATQGTNTGMMYIQLNDGTTPQCTFTINNNGQMILQSGAFGGATLATYSGAVPVISTWYAFEVEIVINNTTGSFSVRKNGNNVNDFTATGLNTRPVSTNNYANKITIGSGGYNWAMDDLYWRSGASVAWMGDIRCVTRMPVTDASVTWSKSPTNSQQNPSVPNTPTGSFSAGIIYSCPITPTLSGKVANVIGYLNAGITGNMTAALYDSTGASGGPGNLIAQTAQIVNPVAGTNLFTFATPPTVQNGVTYHFCLWSNVAWVGVGNAINGCHSLTVAYTGTFPPTMAGFGSASYFIGNSGVNITPFNSGCVGELPQDASNTYVYDNNIGDQDFYNIATIAQTPAVVYAVQSRCLATKSDAGTRIMDLQVKSGATVVATAPYVLTTSAWTWLWRLDITDPNTGAAWLPTAVNGLQVGPKVTG